MLCTVSFRLVLFCSSIHSKEYRCTLERNSTWILQKCMRRWPQKLRAWATEHWTAAAYARLRLRWIFTNVPARKSTFIHILLQHQYCTKYCKTSLSKLLVTRRLHSTPRSSFVLASRAVCVMHDRIKRGRGIVYAFSFQLYAFSLQLSSLKLKIYRWTNFY